MRCTAPEMDAGNDPRSVEPSNPTSRRATTALNASSTDTANPRQQRASDDGAAIRRGTMKGRADCPIACKSEGMQRVLAEVNQVAPTGATVLLLGETGVGKEVMARAIHDASPRSQHPMIRVSCGAIPTTLIESELFGHERGAFTGAWSRQVGRFEAADKSTIFLDEVGELPLEVQVKFLRVLQERTVERLGSIGSIKVDVRVIAATNRDLQEAVREGRFREDLFYRLNVFPITIPPLRERVEDIADLAWAFVEELAPLCGKNIQAISKQSLAELQRHSWAGNVRELRNVIEREIIMATGPTLVINGPFSRRLPQRDVSSRLLDVQAGHIRSVLESCGWRIRGAHGAAARLDIKPTTLESRMIRLGIWRDRWKQPA